MKKILAAALFAFAFNAFAAEPAAGDAKPADKSAKKDTAKKGDKGDKKDDAKKEEAK